ncbi:MAG: hypothetical protein GY734_21675 [Herbaspirillum sp.]|uniref:hypothetical protein n=1 Tax=Herbaspirillum sp. TaxID=1890675 RepID=UPI00258D3FF2|nr:hypothetical protein [Herbaspirillum sp.]MCP3658476.1 hypothetical protein [Herbaspirillum sp.]MCP3950088.1 hypothetical protein [Herbaspirillum sp.]MCP4033829.1 hypothetical protein [Herbaspirillum sp.]
MDTTKYKSKSIYIAHIKQATKLGMSMNEYITHLANLAAQEKTTADANQLERLQALEGTISSLAEALKHQRYLTDTHTRKIDEQTALIAQQSEMLTKLLNAYGADIAFIQALKKEITA